MGAASGGETEARGGDEAWPSKGSLAGTRTQAPPAPTAPSLLSHPLGFTFPRAFHPERRPLAPLTRRACRSGRSVWQHSRMLLVMLKLSRTPRW